MNLLIYSSIFFPSVGGMETAVEILATGFSRQGCVVHLVTNSQLPDEMSEKDWEFNVYRKPSLYTYWKLSQQADVILHNSISLKKLFPDFLFRKKFFIIHHTWIDHISRSKFPLTKLLKFLVTRFVHNIYISNAIAQEIGVNGTIIPNPYNAHLFRKLPEVKRVKDIVFLGRLVSDKGVDILFKALALLKKSANTLASCTIIGDGEDFTYLVNMATDLKIKSQVNFIGKKSGEELVYLLNQHKVMVVPSLWDEPFGIVALEGIACGCLVIGSSGGGLSEAIGACGFTFPNGNVEALAELLAKVLTKPEDYQVEESKCIAHLSRHQKRYIAGEYIGLFQQVLNGRA